MAEKIEKNGEIDQEIWKRANERVIKELQLNWIFILNMNKYFTHSSQSVMPISKEIKIMSTVNYLFSIYITTNNCIVLPLWNLCQSQRGEKILKIDTKLLQKNVFISRPEYLIFVSCWRFKSIHIDFVHVLFSRDFCSLALYFWQKWFSNWKSVHNEFNAEKAIK